MTDLEFVLVPLDDSPGKPRRSLPHETQTKTEDAGTGCLGNGADQLVPPGRRKHEVDSEVPVLHHQRLQTDCIGESRSSPDGFAQDAVENVKHLWLFVEQNWKGAMKLFLRRCCVRLLWFAFWFSRLCAVFWVLEVAAMLCALAVNIVIQFIIGMFVPVAKPDEKINEDIVYTASFFFLVSLLYPILSLLPTVFSLVREVWSHEEMPSTRLMFEYITKGLEKAMEYSNKEFDKVSLVIRVVKGSLVFFFLIVSWGVAQSRVLELFFKIGLFVGLALWFSWIILQLVVQCVALKQRNVRFPTMALFVAIRYHKSKTLQPVNVVQKAEDSPRHNLHLYTLLGLFSVHLVISLFVIGFALRELDASGGTIFLAILLLIVGLVYTYYNMFSSNYPLLSNCSRPDKYCTESYKPKLSCLSLLPPTPNRVADSLMAVVTTIILLIIIMVVAGRFVRDAQEPKCDDANIRVINSSSVQVLPRTRREVGHISGASYDICSQRWYGLTAMDVALLADISYKDHNVETGSGECSVEVHQFLAKYFPQPTWDWEIVGYPEPGELVGFLDLHSRRLNVTVISVRGTRFSSWTDLMQDADLYTEIATLQFFSLFIPITVLLPLDTIADIVYYSSFVERVFHADPSSSYHSILAGHIRNKMGEYGDRVIITGHSLGGTLGKIAGALLKIRAFSFNGPGLLYSRQKFGLSQSDIDSTAVNVVAKGDIVSEVDRLGGTTYRIGCPTDSLISCHRLTTMACELQEKCQFHEGGRRLSC